MQKSKILGILKETFSNYKKDNIAMYAASLSYFTAFSLSPLLILTVSLIGLLLDEQLAQEQAVSQVEKIVGPEASEIVRQIIVNASAPGEGVIATVVGVVLLLFGASQVFSALKTTLNTIWQVRPVEDSGLKKTITDKVLTFSMIAVIGFLFLISLIISIGLGLASTIIQDFLPLSQLLFSLLNFFIPYVLILFLFAFTLRILPDVKIPWRIIFYGAALASFLFSIGRFLLTYYIANTSVASTYGAAASLVVLLLWVFYSAHIFYLSTEYMKAFAHVHGIAVSPKTGSIQYSITTSTEQNREQQKTFEFAERVMSLLLSGLLLRLLKKIRK